MAVAVFRSVSAALIAGSIIAAVSFFFFGSSDTAHADSTFDPTVTIQYCNDLSDAGIGFPAGLDNVKNATPRCDVEGESTTPGGPSTTTTRLNISLGDLNFSNIATLAAPGAGFTPGCNTDTNADTVLDVRVFADGSRTDTDGVDNDFDGTTDPTDTTECLVPGDFVGGLRSSTILGTFNNPCGNSLTIDFLLFNVALPDNPTDPRASSNIYTPAIETTPAVDRLQSGFTAFGAAPLDVVGGGSSAAIQNYPDWLLDVFDPDWRPLFPGEGTVGGPREGVGADPETIGTINFNGPQKPIIPIAAYGSLSVVTNVEVPLYFLQFAPGQLPDPAGDGVGAGDGFQPPHPFSTLLASQGSANQVVLTDTTVAIVSASSITDFCSPLTSNTMLLGTTLGPDGIAGNADDMIRATHPSSVGTHISTSILASFRDTDNDGIENQLDTCQTIANQDGDPRFVDADGDMIDKACDPDGGTQVDNGNDSDGDGLQNAQDNCPNAFNTNQTNEEDKTLVSAYAPDGGPNSDGIGDACDSEAGALSVTQNGVSVSIAGGMSDTVANGHYRLVGIVNPKCFGGTDSEPDGYCTDLDSQDGNSTRHNSWPAQLVGSGAPDRDGDNWSDYLETYLGTEPTRDCAFTTGAGNQNDEGASGVNTGLADHWPSDFDDDGRAGLNDVIKAFVTNLAPTGLNQDASTAKLRRSDFNADGFVSLTDVILAFVTKLAPTGLNLTCTAATQQ